MQPEVTINNHICKTPLELWHDDKHIGTIENDIALLDIRCQIMYRYFDSDDDEKRNFGKYRLTDSNGNEAFIDVNGSLSQYHNGWDEDCSDRLFILIGGNDRNRNGVDVMKKNREDYFRLLGEAKEKAAD